jgi:hypothetical protein
MEKPPSGLTKAVRLFPDNRFKRRTLCFHSNMAVVAEHALRDMARDVHDGLVSSSAFREICDKGVPVVVPPPARLISSDRSSVVHEQSRMVSS